MKACFFICIILLIVSCGPQPASVQELPSETRSFTTSYKPQAFKQDNRIQQIRSVAPEIHRLIEVHAAEKHIPGIAYGVVVEDSLVIASATGVIDLDKEIPATPQSAFRIASMTKSFTAMAILKLRDEGKLSLSDPAEQYIPEMAKLTYPTDDSPVITIENLLTMTAGFPEDNPWGDRQLDEPDQMLLDMITSGVSFSNTPSYQYEYSNLGFALLGNIVSRVSGMPYQKYIQEEILLPLGMEDTYWEYEKVPPAQLALGYRWEEEQWKSEPMLHDGSFGAMGGLITTINDFSKYVSFHLSAWPPRSETEESTLSRSTRREMHTPHFNRLYANRTDRNGDPCPYMAGYGYGLRISEDCNGEVSVGHGGALPGFGSNYIFYPQYGIGLMAFGNLTYTSPWSLQEIEKLLFDQLDLDKRQLPPSAILLERQKQVAELIQTWDAELEEQILAENFYLYQSRAHRKKEIDEIMERTGAIQSVNPIEPYNQLRGRFEMKGENGAVSVFFTLSPESSPKVQRLDVSFKPIEISQQ